MTITERKKTEGHYIDVKIEESVLCNRCGSGWGPEGHDFDVAHGSSNPRKHCQDAHGDPCRHPGCTGRMVYHPPKTRRQWVPATLDVKCCGEWMDCSGFTNTCPICGADYDWNGRRLAPRSCWGEETGESEADILRPCPAEW